MKSYNMNEEKKAMATKTQVGNPSSARALDSIICSDTPLANIESVKVYPQ